MVVHVGAGWLGLRLIGVGALRAKDLKGVRGAVYYMDDDGMSLVRGHVEPGNGSSASTFRFAITGRPEFLGRREHIRSALRAPVVLTDDGTGQKFQGRSVDVSEGGMLVGNLSGNLPGPEARLSFALAPRDSRDPIFGTAIVVRSDNRRAVLALKFEDMPREAADELARVVFENEQNARGSRRR
jgi:hypothetical protein